MASVIAVIGGGYGDEGKGKMVDYFSAKHPDAVVIRSNGGAQAGHCQTGDTIITTVNGLQYIDKLVGNKTNSSISHPLINMDCDIENTSLLFTEKNKSINRITLKNGIELKGTNAHSYYVWNSENLQCEWINTIHLNKDKHQFIIPKKLISYKGRIPNLLPVINETDYVHNKIKLNVNNIDINFLALFMGLMNGAGNFNKKKRGAMRIYFNIKQMDVVEYVKSKLMNMGISVQIKEHTASKQCIVLSFNSSDLVVVLQNQLGVKIETGANKSTPAFVLQGTPKIIIEYIKGLLDSDGTVTFHTIKKNKKLTNGKIKFTNISLKIIKELQQLLYIIGINSTFVADKKKSDKHQQTWTLNINSLQNILLYNKFINFPSKYKRRRLDQLVKFKQESCSNKNTIGYIVKIPYNDKKNIYKQCKKNYRKSDSIRSEFVTSNEFSGYGILKTICNDYHIINIKNIELNYSIEQVYDVTMPKTHSYIANGCISHNTVVTPEGERHIFSHFGSGTFNGVPTFLSSFFVSNPLIFRKEHKEFKSNFGITPKIYVDPDGSVTTPFEMLINQITETMRSHQKHGSVGIGFGETLERDLIHSNFRIADLKLFTEHNLRKFLVPYLIELRDEYVPMRLQPTTFTEEFKAILNNEALINDYLSACQYMMDNIEVKSPSFFTNNTLIFEGAQGLLLDMDYGYFPHVTRSNCGMKNISSILNEIPGEHDVSVNYLTRAYTTRHGAGPLDNESPPLVGLYSIVDKTNIPNKFQGALRFAPLDLDLFFSITEKDFKNYAPRTANIAYIMNCFDHLEKVKETVTYRNIRNRIKRFKYLGSGETRSNVVTRGIY